MGVEPRLFEYMCISIVGPMRPVIAFKEMRTEADCGPKWRTDMASDRSRQSQCFSMGMKSPKIAPSSGGSPDPHLIHGYCGPHHPTCQTAARLVQPFSQDTSSLHDRRIDRQTDGLRHKSVATGRIYAMYIMRPKNGIITR